MIVVDTTVLLYAVGAEHALAEPSRRLIDAIAERRLPATTIVDAIQEFAHVYARRRDRSEAVRRARDYADLLTPLMSPERPHLDEALRLFGRHARLDAFDALLAATAIAEGAEALVSADVAFGEVPGLRHVRPGTAAFEALLAR